MGRGVRFEASWDLDHPVFNAAGQPVMGVTEYDKASPGCVMVSVNGPMLANAETLLRSTIAHEIGHVVFDAPGWILVPPAAPISSGFNSSRKPHDPRELRANEFMGALLVAPSMLRVDLQRKAKQQRLPASPRPSTVMSGAPAYDGRQLDRDVVEEIIFSLDESFGVSESFMRVRLDRYDLLRTGWSWDAR
jgi:Zn-dependent peptidase ImmA (M78 family)